VNRAATRRRCERGLQRIVELAPIRQSGETILERQFARERFRCYAASCFSFLFEIAANRKHQQRQHEQAAQQQQLVDFDRLFFWGGIGLVGENIDLPGIERSHKHDERDQRQILDASSVSAHEVANPRTVHNYP
jgi:hypothetical protein